VAQKKALSLPLITRRSWIEEDQQISLRRQCQLAGVSRSTAQYIPVPVNPEDLLLMRRIDEQYLKRPEYGSPRMTDWLHDQGLKANHKRVERLMRVMGIQAITPGPHTSKPALGHKIYPYLLRNVEIERVNQVWSIDITYVPMKKGYMYLVAVIEWYSRYVLAWQLSNTMDSSFCVQALHAALCHGRPEIFNSDQGSQFTSGEFTGELLGREIPISMDGRGRALDNVFIERLWWSVKYENIYPKHYADGHRLHQGLSDYFTYYNTERKHSSLDKRTPYNVFTEACI
jgi:putative transposase